VTCRVCLVIDDSDKEHIATAYRAGTSVEALAAEFRQSLQDMLDHCATCLNVKPKTKFDRLGDLIDQLTDDVALARGNYQSAPDDKDIALIYTSLAKELRANIETASNLVKPDEAAEEVVAQVVEPLVRDLVMACTTEISRLRDELVAAGLPEQQVTQVSKTRLLGLSQALKTGLTEAVRKVNELYGSNIQAKIQTAKTTLTTKTPN